MATGGTGGSAGGSMAGSGGSGTAGSNAGSGGAATGGSSSGGSGGNTPQNECESYKTIHPTWLWCDDFEDGQSIDQKYPDYSTNGMTVDTTDAFAGQHSLHQQYTAGQVDAGWISFFYGDTLGHDYGPIQTEIYMRWYHKFETGFDGFPPKMARITSIGPGWDKRFGVHEWIDNQEIVADVHVPFSTHANSSGWLPLQHSGFFYSDPANVGRWTCHEMYVKTNTPGVEDGRYTFWIDGAQVVDVPNIDLRGSTDYNFNNAMLDCYWNGGSPKDQSRFYDNFVVSTTPIGCL